MDDTFNAALHKARRAVIDEDTFGEKCLELVQRYQAENWIGYGRNRAVFRRGRFVVKVPLNAAGVGDNQHEAHQFQCYGQKTEGYIPFARCRLAGILLVMEYVEHVGWKKGQPAWCSFVDCGQLGINHKGRLVAYDFGY